MEKNFMGKSFEEFFELVKDMYAEGNYIDVTSCKSKNEKEYELTFYEDFDISKAGIGSFTIGKEILHDKIVQYENRPMHFTKDQIALAVKTAWNEDKELLLYPEDMDLIVVDIPREEHCYLTKTRIITARDYNNKEELEEELSTYYAYSC